MGFGVITLPHLLIIPGDPRGTQPEHIRLKIGICRSCLAVTAVLIAAVRLLLLVPAKRSF